MRKSVIRYMTVIMIAVLMTVMVNPITVYAAIDTVSVDDEGNGTSTNGETGETTEVSHDGPQIGHSITVNSNNGNTYVPTGSYNGRDYKNTKYYPQRSTTHSKKSDTDKTSDTGKGNKNRLSSNGEAVLNFSYFTDEYFFQLNTKIFPEEVYKLSNFSNLTVNSNGYDFDDSIDDSHYATAYVAPVMYGGTSYMSVYDYTYVYSNDDLTAAFMDLMASDSKLRKQIMTDSEYNDAKAIYAKYVNSSKYDVNPYIYHYIVEYIDITYGDKLFDYDFYCDKYPMLADLFEYDEDALKQHFYSVGMFEGRQGIATFNVDNYTTSTKDLASYYIKYVTSSDSSKSYKKTSKDTYQIRLYDVGFEAYVLDVEKDHESSTFRKDLADPYIQGELNALASDRVRFQLSDFNSVGHDRSFEYFDSDTCALNAINLGLKDFTQVSENIFSKDALNNFSLSDKVSQEKSDTMITWRNSTDHYNAAVNDVYIYVGQSHIYADYNSTGKGSGVKANTVFYTGLSIMFGRNDASKLDSVYASK